MRTVDKTSPKKKSKRRKMLFWRKENRPKSNTEHAVEADVPERDQSEPRDEVSTKNRWTQKVQGEPEVEKNRRAYLQKKLFPPKRLVSKSRQSNSDMKSKNDEPRDLASRTQPFHPASSGSCTAKERASPSSGKYTAAKDPSDMLDPMNDPAPLLDPMDDYEHTCAICYEILVRPHAVRPCGHTFCESCLRQLQATTAVWAWVLCPICREGIKKCELKHEMDATVRSRYPARYNERHRVLQQETKKQENSRLPCAPARSNGYLRKQAAAPRIRQRPPRSVYQILIYSGCFVLGSLVCCLLGIYLTHLVTTLGLMKLCVRAVGQDGRVLTNLRGNNSVKRRWIRGLSLVLFLATLKAMMSLSWGSIFLLLPSVVFLSGAGYTMDGDIAKTLFNLVRLELACFD
ncbi:E3 ubiquitin-protein ligase rnf180-like [Plakobranchus ocellatus]|uniref:E3 ubiquitin-protein ligase rnf180-like n=1 Tax=Plakobranchus ocellatus TaxID=259542 RepID=A0AAV4C5I2_9GAST|nr:E3 ubiquitin-protein ligase rnf180-like [Plakobranchus ocellatus]